MKIKYKITIIVVTIPIVFFGFFMVGPILFMIASNAYSGFIISNTSEETFEKEFAKIPEVNYFIEKYPGYSTSHSGDFLGWKVILYDAKVDAGNSVHLYVKKSVLHQGVRVSAGCNDNNFGFAFDIPQEQVMDYLKNEECEIK